MSTWFITGTSSGFGRMLTKQLLADGHRVAATLRRPEAVDDLRAQYGERIWVAKLDVTDADRVRKIVDAAFTELGTIDVVVNNAGYGLFAAVEESTDEQIRQVIETDLIGSISVIRAALPHLRSQRYGRIIQISSAGGQTTYPNFSAYHAAKWGIEGFCQTVAMEVAPFGIGLTIVEPGATSTGFSTAVERGAVLPEYEDTPAGALRRAIDGGAFEFPNDSAKIAAAIIASAQVDPAPLRLPLGVDAYDDVRASLVDRLAQHDAARALARSVAVG
ncbi:SDR family oxidoreductase [Streptomyces misionensis]|uniref:SDR family oxidoreductase n=1 Tax=Streptomyces misionensis TaxID=67331 RepID=UPI0033ED77E4